jgi:hypothetical protein
MTVKLTLKYTAHVKLHLFYCHASETGSKGTETCEVLHLI